MHQCCMIVFQHIDVGVRGGGGGHCMGAGARSLECLKLPFSDNLKNGK